MVIIATEASGVWREHAVPVREAGAAVEALVAENLHADCYISQQVFYGGRRVSKNLCSLGVVAVDIDVEKKLGRFDIKQVLVAVTRALEAREFPLPSYMVFSGHGLHAKWLLSEPLPAKAQSRWKAVLRELLKILAPWGADVMAADVCRVLRLPGTYNHKPTQGRHPEAAIVWVNGGADVSTCKRYPFDYLAAKILPLTRDQCAEARKRTKLYAKWQRQREARLVLDAARPRVSGSRKGLEQAPVHWLATGWSPVEQSVFDLASRRLRHLEHAIDQTFNAGVIPEGMRNNVSWLAAACVAAMTVACGRPDAAKQVQRWVHRYVPSYTAHQALNAAFSVLQRAAHPNALSDKKRGLYKFFETTWKDRLATALNVLPSALPLRTLSGSRDSANRGKLGLAKIRGLSPKAFAVRRRQHQAAGGQYAAANRVSNHSAGVEQRACDLARLGLSIGQIVEQMGVPKSTVTRWTKGIRDQIKASTNVEIPARDPHAVMNGGAASEAAAPKSGRSSSGGNQQTGETSYRSDEGNAATSHWARRTGSPGELRSAAVLAAQPDCGDGDQTHHEVRDPLYALYLQFKRNITRVVHANRGPSQMPDCRETLAPSSPNCADTAGMRAAADARVAISPLG
ncbi:MAG: hypothetical protein V4787_02200 [Pseudomonadota bacterium]